MQVYISRPAVQSGITLVPATDADAGLLFNLPCTIAGGKGTVHINSTSLVDTGCATLSLLSKRAASRLALTPQTVHSDIRACGRCHDTVSRTNITARQNTGPYV